MEPILMIVPGLQTVGDATELLTIKEVTIIGVLVFLVVLLIGAVAYLFRKNEKLNELRLLDHREFTKDLLVITEKTSDTVKQVNEILKITQRNVRN
jgi:hypothetical protein